MRTVQVIGSAGSRLVALVNPAWKGISDFSFFGAGQAKKTLLPFDLTYSLKSLVVYGYTVRRAPSPRDVPRCPACLRRFRRRYRFAGPCA